MDKAEKTIWFAVGFLAILWLIVCAPRAWSAARGRLSARKNKRPSTF